MLRLRRGSWRWSEGGRREQTEEGQEGRVGRTSGRTYYRHTDDGDGAAAGQPFPAAFAQ